MPVGRHLPKAGTLQGSKLPPLLQKYLNTVKMKFCDNGQKKRVLVVFFWYVHFDTISLELNFLHLQKKSSTKLSCTVTLVASSQQHFSLQQAFC